jgi:hypothetical protein
VDLIMKFAMCALAALVVVAGLAPMASAAAIPDGTVAVVRVTAIDGLAGFNGPTTEARSSAFSFDGTDYNISRSALGSLDGVKTLVLIDRRTDSVSGGKLVHTYSQDVRAVDGSSFDVTDVPGKSLSYQVASIAGNLRLLGGGDQIVATGGENGPYHIWRVDGVDLVPADSIVLH